MENKIKLTERHKTRADKYNYPYFDCEVGDIVYFPIWESQDSPKKIKGRPVLVLKKMGGHAIVAEITKHDRRPNFKGEIVLNRYWDYGLEKLSTLRLNQQADILLNDVVFKIGTLTHDTDTFDYVFEELESLEDGDIDMRMFRDRKEPKVLNNSMETDNEDKIKKIDDFINDVYKMRSDSIASDGEYGKGNLVFKELRNRGYLDKLRDLKVELETDEMSLTESKADIQKFIDKFGKDNYDKFVKMKDRLKNNNISVDIVYHVAHTSKEDMDKLLYDAENKVVKDVAGNKTMNVVKAYEDDKWIIYDVKDWQTSMNLGDGTGWCITGRYKTKEEVKSSQAEHYFNKYLENMYSMYLFVMDKSTDKAEYCICPMQDILEKDMDVWNKEDKNIGYTSKIPDFEYNGFKYFDSNALRVEDDTLVGEAPKDIESYEIPEGVEKIDGYVFYNCTNLKRIEIPDSVTEIGSDVFKGCKSLDNVVLPSGLKFIGMTSFFGCDSLKKIIIPNGMKDIAMFEFSECESLKDVVLPDSLTRIGYKAFAKCSSLKEIILPEGVERLDYGCFNRCKNLKKVFIPKSVLEVENDIFEGSKNLTIYCEAESKPEGWYKNWNPDNRPVVWGCTREKYLNESLNESKEDKQAFIDKFGKEIYDKFIKLKDRLKNNKVSVDIVYHTAHTSKEDMNKLLSDTENKVVKDTNTNSTHMNVVKVFEDDKWLIYDVKDWETAMNLGEGTTWCITGRYKTKEVKPSQAEQYFNKYLEERYFMYLFVMDKSTGQATYCICPIKDYENGADIWNREDYKVDYAEGVPDFEYNGYKYFDAKTFRVVDGVLTGQAPIDIESYEIPDGVKTIDGCVFENCDKLKSIKFPESVTYIGYRAFNGCKRLNNVVLPSKLEVISSYAFSECKSLTKINLPETLETIVGGAFSGCSSLEEIKLPSLLKNLGDSVFEDCTSLKSIVIPSSVQEICNDAFDGCKNLSSVTLPNGVVYIDDDAFARCNSLTELVLPDSVRQIGRRCFYGCDNLKKIYLPRSVLNVFEYAFRYCSKLTIYCKDDEDALNYWDDDWNPDNRPVVWNCSVEKYLAEDLSTSKLRREENVDGIGFYVATKMTIKDYCNLINVKECESLDELSDELLDKAVEEQITYWDFDLNELKSGAVIPEENGVYVRLGNDTEGYRYYETHLNNDSFEYKKKQQQ